MALDVDLRHRFGSRRPDANGDGGGFVLDAAFAAPTPGVTALFGPSGCGKSTVVAAVAGLLRPQRGRVALDGAAMLDTARGVFVPPERRRCGVVFQDARLFPHLSVERNLRFGLRRAPRRAEGPDFGAVVDTARHRASPVAAPGAGCRAARSSASRSGARCWPGRGSC